MLGTGDIIGEGIQLTQRNSTTADDDNGGGPEGRVPLREEAPVSHHGNQQALEGLGGADTNKDSSQGAKNENSYGPVDHRLVQEILSSVSQYYNANCPALNHGQVVKLVDDSIRTCDLRYGEKEALEYGDGFEWQQTTIDADLEFFHACGGDLVKMAKLRLRALKEGRLNLSRVCSLRPDNPEIERLKGLCEGMQVPKPPDFVPNGATTQKGLHQVYKRVAPAVNRMLGDLHDQQLGFVLPEKIVRARVVHHRMMGKWALKFGKKCGRNIGDMSFGEGPYLNGKWAKDEAAEIWGDIIHPTIQQIAMMVMEFWDKVQTTHPNATWSDLVLWKMDLKGAYTLIDVLPDQVGMFAQELTQDLVYFHLCGVFGWSCTPAAFQVVTRAIKWELKHILEGLADMYVDDLLGVCLLSMLDSELKKAHKVCTGLLGDGSVAEHKTEFSRRLEVIGWVIDLDLNRLSVARKNLLKTIYCMYTIDLDQKTDLVELERVASYSQRYVLICRVLAPFQACFNRMIKLHWHKHCKFDWSPEAKIAIRMWRAMLYLVSADELHYTRSLESFLPQEASFTVETDGSLQQIGFLIKRIAPNGTETCLGGGAVSIEQYGFKKNSGFQNTAEFIGAVMGIIALIKMGGKDTGVLLRGDSVSALRWGREEKIKGEEALNAGIVMSAICVKHGINVCGSDFLKGTDNWKTDDLSRSAAKGWTVETVMQRIGYEGAEVIDLSEDAASRSLIAACNPSGGIHVGENDCGSEEEFIRFWHEVRGATEGLRIGTLREECGETTV
jgi:hypothetical protein